LVETDPQPGDPTPCLTTRPPIANQARGLKPVDQTATEKTSVNRDTTPPVNVAGVHVHPVGMAQTVDVLREWLQGDRQRLAVGVNAHLVNLAAANTALANWLQKVDLLYPDGQSVVWACRALGAGAPDRVATTDLIHPLAQMCARERAGMFFFGAAPGIAAAAADRLRAAEPAVRIETHHGYVQPGDMPSVVERINASGASVLLVGLGDPLQQHWLAEHRAVLQPRLLMTCGGLFDWVSGGNRRPPEWLVRGGLEWAWRLGLEPKRLARRYLLGNPAFMLRFARSWLADRRH